MYFPDSMVAAAADRRACRDLLRCGSRTFFAAAHVLPASVRDPATALYAFCRLADDAVDLSGTATGGQVARLGARLDRAYRGQPMSHFADRAFSETVLRFAIPREIPQALLEGLDWDVNGRRYESFSDLMGYAARVAGTVGIMMALIMGVRDRNALARACDLGAAMQLTNIARDVGEDARNGRLYLPLAWMREAGLDPDAWLEAPTCDAALTDVVRRLLGEAEALYRRSEFGIAMLPRSCRPGIWAARLLYARIGDVVARRGYDSVSARASTTLTCKLRLLALAVLKAGRTTRERVHDSALPEARFLLEAVWPLEAVEPRRLHPGDQITWVLQLFERIEQRRRIAGGA